MAKKRPTFSEEDLEHISKLFPNVGKRFAETDPLDTERVLKAITAISEAVRRDDIREFRKQIDMVEAIIERDGVPHTLDDILNNGDGMGGNPFLIEAVYAGSPKVFERMFAMGASQNVTAAKGADEGMNVAQVIAAEMSRQMEAMLADVTDGKTGGSLFPNQENETLGKLTRMSEILDPLFFRVHLDRAMQSGDVSALTDCCSAFLKRDYKPADQRREIYAGKRIVNEEQQGGILIPSQGMADKIITPTEEEVAKITGKKEHSTELLLPQKKEEKEEENITLITDISGGDVETHMKDDKDIRLLQEVIENAAPERLLVLKEVLDQGDKVRNPVLIQVVLEEDFNPNMLRALVELGADAQQKASRGLYKGTSAADILAMRLSKIGQESQDTKDADIMKEMLLGLKLLGVDTDRMDTISRSTLHLPQQEEESTTGKWAKENLKTDGRVNRSAENESGRGSP